jgi:cell division inhibitor SepF
MASKFKNALSFLGMADVSQDDQDADDDPQAGSQPVDGQQTFDTDPSVSAQEQEYTVQHDEQDDYGQDPLSRIVTIHPKSYDDAQQVGVAIRQGTPVVLNLTDVSESVAYRIVDFSAGVVFGLRGKIERVTPRVFLLSPSSVAITRGESGKTSSSDFFGD